MADLICDICEAEPAALIVSRTNDGETLTLGPQCAPDMLARMAAAFRSPDKGDPVADTAGSNGSGDATGAAEPDPLPRQGKGRRGRQPAASTAAEVDEAETPPTAQ
jgi:hypothetical protein